MVASINRVIGKQGVEVRYNPSGTACASFMLIVSEVGSDGKEHQLWLPCEVWGKKAEAAGELDPGDVVLVEGKLRRQKKGETWETVISSFECQPLTLPAHAGATAEGRND